MAVGEPNILGALDDTAGADELLPEVPLVEGAPKLNPAPDAAFVADEVDAAATEEPKLKLGFALGLLVEEPWLLLLSELAAGVEAAGEVPKLNFAAPPAEADEDRGDGEDEGASSDPKVFFATAGPPKGDALTDPCPCPCLLFSA